MSVHWGRDTRQCPPLRPRTSLLSTASWVSTLGATDTLALFAVPTARPSRPASSGTCSRNA